jgi:hypothetical protein
MMQERNVRVLEKIQEHVLACTLLDHVWQSACIQTFCIWHIIVRSCFYEYKQIHIRQGFTTVLSAFGHTVFEIVQLCKLDGFFNCYFC